MKEQTHGKDLKQGQTEETWQLPHDLAIILSDNQWTGQGPTFTQLMYQCLYQTISEYIRKNNQTIICSVLNIEKGSMNKGLLRLDGQRRPLQGCDHEK